MATLAILTKVRRGDLLQRLAEQAWCMCMHVMCMCMCMCICVCMHTACIAQ